MAGSLTGCEVGQHLAQRIHALTEGSDGRGHPASAPLGAMGYWPSSCWAATGANGMVAVTGTAGEESGMTGLGRGCSVATGAVADLAVRGKHRAAADPIHHGDLVEHGRGELGVPLRVPARCSRPPHEQREGLR